MMLALVGKKMMNMQIYYLLLFLNLGFGHNSFAILAQFIWVCWIHA
jgi:hypothetical protein